MKVRLAFSVAAHLQTDILLMDEVLAVGDIAFQQKCIGKIGEVNKNGKSVIFVSHNTSAINSLCNKVLYLKNGTVQSIGETKQIISQYLSDYQNNERLTNEVSVQRNSYRASKTFENLSLEVKKDNLSNAPIEVFLDFQSLQDISDPRIMLHLCHLDGSIIASTLHNDTSNFKENNGGLQKGNHRFNMTIPANFLGKGSFMISVTLVDPLTEQVDVPNAGIFNVDFQGYNNIYWDNAAQSPMRPKWDWRRVQ
jgi:lipopolysaccharide transport system ATP-binding protein